VAGTVKVTADWKGAIVAGRLVGIFTGDLVGIFAGALVGLGKTVNDLLWPYTVNPSQQKYLKMYEPPVNGTFQAAWLVVVLVTNEPDVTPVLT